MVANSRSVAETLLGPAAWAGPFTTAPESGFDGAFKGVSFCRMPADEAAVR
ncbi:hypothetical protein [Homoserinimonas sp. OAct 916]|uniref:hypothetical protein n=1 Tax=Homoserinimonas sp. OAct 916 TaxID=2211450 RepID=UPI0013004B54|nr:hypothetical protein [Homoserinimonas sp. OAct 916]